MTRWWKWQDISLSSSLGELFPVLCFLMISPGLATYVTLVTHSAPCQCPFCSHLNENRCKTNRIQMKCCICGSFLLAAISGNSAFVCARLQMCTNGWHNSDSRVQTASGRWTVLSSVTLRPLCQFCSHPQMVYTDCFIFTFFMWTCSANCEAGILQLKRGGRGEEINLISNRVLSILQCLYPKVAALWELLFL